VGGRVLLILVMGLCTLTGLTLQLTTLSNATFPPTRPVYCSGFVCETTLDSNISQAYLREVVIRNEKTKVRIVTLSNSFTWPCLFSTSNWRGREE
jgi:hypothetical protein